MNTRTTVEILNNSLEKVAEVRALYPINKAGMVLRYSKELSDYGECLFRIATEDPMFEEYGDIIVPHKYHVRIKRGRTVVWQGAIVDNPSRQKNYQEIIAYQYLYYLDKILVKRTKEANAGEGKHYREYNSGTMATNIITTLTEAKAAFGSSHIMSGLTFPTANIQNPTFPAGYLKADGTALTGAWTFSSTLFLQFDYHSVLYVLQAFANYAKSDFKIDNDLVFSFKNFLGNKHTNLTFNYGLNERMGNIVDYDVPRYGRRMANELFGIAVGEEGKVLYSSKRDSASVLEYGLLQTAQPFADDTSTNTLKTRIEDELRFIKDPESAPINLILNEKGYPLGQYDVGDLISVIIKDNVIDYNQTRRIVKISVQVHNTGREMTTIETNPPKDDELGA